MKVLCSVVAAQDSEVSRYAYKGEVGAPARTPTQVERKRREVVSVGLRSCPSIARRSSTTNCVHQLRIARHPCQLQATGDVLVDMVRALLLKEKPTKALSLSIMQQHGAALQGCNSVLLTAHYLVCDFIYPIRHVDL